MQVNRRRKDHPEEDRQERANHPEKVGLVGLPLRGSIRQWGRSPRLAPFLPAGLAALLHNSSLVSEMGTHHLQLLATLMTTLCHFLLLIVLDWRGR